MAIGTGVRPDTRSNAYGRSAGAWRSTAGRPAIDRRTDRCRAGARKGVGEEWMGWVGEGRVIPYLPGLGKEVGSAYAALLLQQVVYRWVRNDGQPFYKFKGPCGHRLYRPGDSWTEELGVGRRDFDNALRRIAVRKTAGMTLEEAMAAGTPVVYWHTGDRRMFFTVNPAGLSALLGRLRSSQRAPDEGCPEDADDPSDEMAWEAGEPSAGLEAEGDAGAEEIAVEIRFGERAPTAKSAARKAAPAPEVGSGGAPWVLRGSGKGGPTAKSTARSKGQRPAGSSGAREPGAPGNGRDGGTPKSGPYRAEPGAPVAASAGGPGAECDPSRGVLAAESDSSAGRLVAEGDPSRGVLAAENDSSAGRLGAECDSSRGVLTAEGDSSTGRLEAESDSSAGRLGAECDSSRGVLAAESDSSAGRLGAECDSSRGVLAAQSDSSAGRLGAECDSSRRGLESEIDSRKGHLAAECAATSTEKTTKTSRSGRDAVFYSDWGELKRELKLGMLTATYDQMMRDLTYLPQDGRLLICGPPKTIEWLDQRYRPTIETTLRDLAGLDGLLAPPVEFAAYDPGRQAAGKASMDENANQVRTVRSGRDALPAGSTPAGMEGARRNARGRG